jgi:hypothetical protein
MNIINRKAKDLIPAEYNPRTLSEKEFKDIKDSLQRFGFVKPIIINSNPDRKDIIVGGHQRVKVADAIGIKEIPTLELNLNLDQEKELNIRLNKNTGSWDFEALANYFEPEDLIDWGFTEWELDFSPDVEEEEDDKKPFVATTYVLRVDCEDEVQMNALKEELEEKGYTVG